MPTNVLIISSHSSFTAIRTLYLACRIAFIAINAAIAMRSFAITTFTGNLALIVAFEAIKFFILMLV